MSDALALHAFGEPSGLKRWVVSAGVIVGLHVGAIAAALALQAPTEPAGVALPAIMVDMAPASAAPQASPLDLAPGPEMQQADDAAPPPEPDQAALAPQQIEATPPQPEPVVVAPPEHKALPENNKSEQTRIDRQRRQPAKPKRVAKLHPSELPPAPQTRAAPQAERVAPNQSAASAGARAAAILPSYRALLTAHLQRFKQYPAASRAAGEQGTAALSFTVSRSGQVLSSRLASSSGHHALDAETLAMIRRAQPLPSFPPEINQASLGFTVPVRFSVR
jgi:protein TonB